LPKQNRSRLLEPYVTTKGRKGTGLGLAIVQKIVEQHGGNLALDDAPPAPDGEQTTGARLSITLPLGRTAAGPTEQQNEAPEEPDGETPAPDRFDHLSSREDDGSRHSDRRRRGGYP
jgi:two-component system nitrogen regulation sensor histidine kinase NtrY